MQLQLTHRTLLGFLLTAAFALMALGFAGVTSAHSDSSDNGGYSSGSSSSSGGMNDDENGDMTFEASLSGKEEVPPVSTTTTTGDSTVTTDESNGNAQYWLSVWDGEDITAAHIHCGSPGENGPVVVGLFSDSNGVDINGQLSNGTIEEDDIADSATGCSSVIGYEINDLADFRQALQDEDLYVNVHSKTHPNGVARGQLIETDANNGNGNDDSDKDHDWNKDGNDWKDWDHHQDRNHDDWNNNHDGKDGWDGKDGQNAHNWDKNHDDNTDWSHENRDWNKDDHGDWEDSSRKAPKPRRLNDWEDNAWKWEAPRAPAIKANVHLWHW